MVEKGGGYHPSTPPPGPEWDLFVAAWKFQDSERCPGRRTV